MTTTLAQVVQRINASKVDGVVKDLLRRLADATATVEEAEAYITGSELNLDAGIVLPNASGYGIKLDNDTPAYGWRDLIGEVELRGSGPNDPTYATYGATALRQYQFSASAEKEVFVVYHVPHDYAPGTDIYFHAHWSNAEATPNTGNVVWGFDYSFAKGYNQGAFPALTTVTVTQACPATRYQHNIAETTAVTISGLETDGLILCRIYRKAADAADTCSDAVFLHTADIHYQSTNVATKNRNSDFWT